MSYQESLGRVIADVTAPAAADVDRSGSFPRASVDALQAAGLLALSVPEEYGGAGLGLAAGADVVRELANACSSTAMVVSGRRWAPRPPTVTTSSSPPARTG